MITNPWVNRITALVTLIAIYAVGYAGGKEQAIQQRPVCYTTIKP